MSRRQNGHNSPKAQRLLSQTPLPTKIHPANTIFTNIILQADKHTIPKCTPHENFYLNVSQQNHIRKLNNCGPSLTALNVKITSDIYTHKQDIIWTKATFGSLTQHTHTLEDKIFSQNCPFHHRRMESLEHFLMCFLDNS